MFVMPFVLAATAVEVTPGPNMGYLIFVGLNRGRSAGFAVVAGIAAGLSILGGLASLSLSFLFENAGARHLLGWFGTAYMLWLAYEAWQQTDKPRETIEAVNSWSFFFQGLITNLLNPKAALFYLVVLPNFIELEPAPILLVLTLVTLHVLIATGVHLLIVIFSSFFKPFFESPSRRRASARTAAILLAGVALWTIFENTP